MEAAQTTSFDYLMVMPGVVAALALGRLLSGVAQILPRPNRPEVKLYWIPCAWAGILFVLQILYWHTTRKCSEIPIAQDLSHYLLFFIFPTMVYLAATVLMPKSLPPSQPYSLRNHYYDHALLFFIICGIGMAFEASYAEELQCEKGNLDAEITYRWIGCIASLGLALTSRMANTRTREWIHGLGVIFILGLLVQFIARFRPGE